jgi:hypothetical protein
VDSHPAHLILWGVRKALLPPWLWSAAAVLPLFVWWMGWYPGFASSDSIDQLIQARTGVYYNHHPAIHTFYLDILSLDTTRPGLVSLTQIALFVGLLAYACKRLVEVGVPSWLAIGAAWLLGLSPAIAPTTIGLWKDVLFAFFLMWAWIELLYLSGERAKAGMHWSAMARLGAALSGVWLVRGNGPITVLITLLTVAWIFRRNLRGVSITAGTLLVIVFMVTVPLYGALGVSGDGVEPAQVFLPDIAASYVNNPASFTEKDIEMLTALAPLSIWTSRYTCFDSTTLLFDTGFDHSPVRENPAAYRRLVRDVLTRDFGSVVGHRMCAANFIYVPDQPSQDYFQPPQASIPDNDIGLTRDPVSWTAYTFTFGIWSWAEVNDRLWLTWRPGIVILPALAAIGLFAMLPAGRRFLIPSSLFLAHLLNVTMTSPAQEFRFAYPLYIVAVLTLTLVYPTMRGYRGDTSRRPSSSSRSSSGPTSRVHEASSP